MGSNTSHLCWALSPRPVWVEGVSGDKRRRWLPPTWTESGSLLFASLSGKGGTALPSQPVAMVHMIPQPRGRGPHLGAIPGRWPQYCQQFPQDPPPPPQQIRGQRHIRVVHLGSGEQHGEPPPLPAPPRVGLIGGVQAADHTVQLALCLCVQDPHTPPWALGQPPLSSRPGLRGKFGAWVGRGGPQRKEPLDSQLQEEAGQAGGVRTTSHQQQEEGGCLGGV